MKRFLIALLLAISAISILVWPVMAATTATVTITFTPGELIAIANSGASKDFGTLANGSNANTGTGFWTVTNTSNVAINVTVGVDQATWTGGTAYAHNDSGSPGADAVALKASDGDGAYDVIVKYDTPNALVTNKAAATNFDWELKIWAGTTQSDTAQKTNHVVLTASKYT